MTMIRAARDDDFFPWLTLYEGYAEFYHQPLTDQRSVKTWQWIVRGDHGLRAFVAENGDGDLVGLAHVRTIAQPLEGTTALYLDDLFVAESARGAGVATELLEFLRSLASSEGRSGVSWITADDNAAAQAVYDKLATRTSWVTYEMAAQSTSSVAEESGP
ncbi:ribosomal protein S18 acetylase RimI-like enzyme [Labedella gwakjiensis]|uniref:GNAT family N-acetyltransferase n=1 Tax=Labedella gwakjiensis TaxID=390269 RepID=A0A2P8H0F3_9MICO|nr:GNAT family N-acetyltransferase [Labedella gwakjiensis]PSL39701.1 ribosomal protein S18 acetylase RimI-like enzyme [Labedella gwakjiensis]RUQ85913.1 GNAT family N-acetyltransferase [Labedella gwakjiensis]